MDERVSSLKVFPLGTTMTRVGLGTAKLSEDSCTQDHSQLVEEAEVSKDNGT